MALRLTVGGDPALASSRKGGEPALLMGVSSAACRLLPVLL